MLTETQRSRLLELLAQGGGLTAVEETEFDELTTLADGVAPGED